MSTLVRSGVKLRCLRLTGGMVVPVNRSMSASGIDIPFMKTSPRPSYVHRVENQHFVGLTMGEVIDQSVDRFGDRMAVIDRPQQIRKTFSQLHTDIEKLATGFLALNLRKGDRIGIWSPNRYEWTVPINAAYQPAEFEFCLRKLQFRALVAPESFRTQEYYKIINKVIPEVAGSKPGQIKSKDHPYFDTLILLSDKDIPGAFKFKDVIEAGGSNEMTELKSVQKQIQFDDPLSVFFTSGSTGHPKASVHTHFSVINNCIGVNEIVGYAIQTRQYRICCSLPFFHMFGGVGINCTMMTHGIGVVLPAPGFVAEAALKAIEEEKCTNVYGTPTMFHDMMRHPNFSKTDLSSVISGGLGGASCSPALMRSIMTKFNAPETNAGYGATECAVVTVFNHSDDPRIKEEGVGRIIPNVEVKLVDENGSIVPIGSQGEICVRGYSVQKEYWEDEKSTKEAVKDNWFYTGDIGILTEDDRIKFVGRKKEMISRGGTKIFPAEIEEFLSSHPKIAEVSVIGVSNERLGEEVCAWIKLQDGQTMSETDVKEFCKGQMAYFKIPQYVHFVKDYPRTAIGKPKKFEMQEEMETILKSTKINS